MPRKDEKRLRVGVLGCGPIAQAAHFESCTKARNADLYAICDVADDLRDRMAATHAPEKSYADYGQMLADPDLDAVIIATSDTFHVKAAELALDAGKHVLCEARMAMNSREAHAMLAASRRNPSQIAQIVPAPGTLAVDRTIADTIASGASNGAARRHADGDDGANNYVEPHAHGWVW